MTAGQSVGKCHQCERNAIWAYATDQVGVTLDLCLEHGQQYEEVGHRRIALLERQSIELEDRINDVWGLPRPRREPRVIYQRVLMNQVHIHGNNNGIVNTGTIQTIEQHLSVAHGIDAELTDLIRRLTDAVIAAPELSQTQKQEASDLLVSVSREASQAPGQRSPVAVVRAIGSALKVTIGAAPAVLELWKLIAPHFGWPTA